MQRQNESNLGQIKFVIQGLLTGQTLPMSVKRTTLAGLPADPETNIASPTPEHPRPAQGLTSYNRRGNHPVSVQNDQPKETTPETPQAPPVVINPPDEVTTKSGRPRKRRKQQSRMELAREQALQGGETQKYVFSNENMKIEDFCNEFNNTWYVTGKSPREMEQQGKEWRTDPKAGPGKTRSTSFKTAWSCRAAIFNIIIFYINHLGGEQQALERANEIFQQHIGRKSPKPNLANMSKAINAELKRMDAFTTRTYQ